MPKKTVGSLISTPGLKNNRWGHPKDSEKGFHYRKPRKQKIVWKKLFRFFFQKSSSVSLMVPKNYKEALDFLKTLCFQ